MPLNPVTADVEVGCHLWVAVAEEAVMDDVAVGGVVHDIEDVLDEETGELVRVFYVVRQFRGGIRWHRLRADQVGEVSLPNMATIRSVVRALHKAMGQRRGPFVSDDVRDSDVAQRLMSLSTSPSV